MLSKEKFEKKNSRKFGNASNQENGQSGCCKASSDTEDNQRKGCPMMDRREEMMSAKREMCVEKKSSKKDKMSDEKRSQKTE